MGLTRPRAYQIFDIDYKQAVRVITLTNITLGGGAPSQVDGVNLSLNDRVLVAGQSTASQNGLYYVTTVGTGSSGTWQRSIDGNETGEIQAGMIVMVTEGNNYADTQWKLTTNDPITIGVSALTFEQSSAYAFGTVVANATSITADTVGDTLTLTAGNNIVITGNATSDTVTFAVSETVGVTGNISGANIIASGIVSTNNTLIVNSTEGEGGQLVMSWPGISGLTGQANSTWNLDVDSSNNLRAFSVNAVGTANVILNLNSATRETTVGGNLLPSANVTYNLGSPTQRWNEIFLAANTIDIGGATISADLVTGSLILTGPDGAEFILTGNDADDALGAFGFLSAGNTEPATSTTTGALTVAGGAGIAGNVYVGGIVDVAGNSIYLGNLVLKDNGSNIFGLYAADGTTPATISQSSVDTTKISNGTSNVQVVSSNANVSISVGGVSNVAVFSSTGATVTGDLTVTGNATLSGNILGDRIQNGTTSIDIQESSGNANISIDGTSNVAVFSSTGANISGILGVSGNVTGSNLNTAGQVVATGNITGGNITAAGRVATTGNIDTAGTININSSSGMYNVLNITGAALVGYGSSQTWKFFTQNSVGGGPGSWILFPDSSLQTTAYPGTTSALSLSGNITGGNLISNVAVVASGNVTGGNLITAGLISATGNITSSGNITGGNILGNGAGLSGINAFSTVAVTGGNSAIANSIAGTLTIAAGSGISLVMDSDTDTLTIAAGASGESIFSTGGQMELVTDVVTTSEDLGLVTEVPAAQEYDLGGLFIDGFVGNPNFLPNSIYGNILVADAVISTTGNITAGNLVTTGITSTGSLTATANVSGGNLVSTGAVYSNFNTNTANTGSFMATGSNTKGGTGYLDFLVVNNTGNGVTNPYKWFRTDTAGKFEIINSAYTSSILNLTDGGNLSIAGQYQVSGKQAVNGPAFRAYIAVNQAITSGSQQKVTFGSETFDTNNNFASSRFTPTVEGYYQLNATVRLGGVSGTGEIMITIWKNGSEYARGTNESGTEQGAGWYSMQVSDLAYANGTGDYFEIYVQQTSGSNKDTTAGSNISYFSGVMVRGA